MDVKISIINIPTSDAYRIAQLKISNKPKNSSPRTINTPIIFPKAILQAWIIELKCEKFKAFENPEKMKIKPIN